ncbi:MAG: efflux RND transporter periplasmic adaptor subunit [Gemmatimonadota bacterium]
MIRRSVRAAASLTLALWMAACGRGASADGGADSSAAATRVPVGIGIVRQDTLSERLELVGRLMPVPGGSAILTAPAAGVVQSVKVQVGSLVRDGELLLQLESPELTTSARELRLAAQTAERDARRQADLLAQGITSQRQADERASQAESARSAADAADALLARTRVTSPIRGAVQRVSVQQGERVEAGAPLVEVVNSAALDLMAAAPASALGRLRAGAMAEVRAEGADQSTTGRIRATAPAVDSTTNSGQVVIRISNPGPSLRPGLGARASVTLGVKRGLIVPDSALVLVGDSMSVFVVGADSAAHQRAVVVDLRQGAEALVRGDLKAGDKVATSGAFGLVDGMHVVPATAPKE